MTNISFNEDGTQGSLEGEVNNFCIQCGRGIRSWFHGQGFICYSCKILGGTIGNPRKFKLIEVKPAVVYHCSDVDNRKIYYIQVLEGPPSSQSCKVFDELDEPLAGVAFVKFEFNDIAENYRASVTYKDGVLNLFIIGIVPWHKPNVDKDNQHEQGINNDGVVETGTVSKE